MKKTGRHLEAILSDLIYNTRWGVVRHTCSCSPDHEPHTFLTSHCSPSQETSYVSMSSGFC